MRVLILALAVGATGCQPSREAPSPSPAPVAAASSPWGTGDPRADSSAGRIIALETKVAKLEFDSAMREAGDLNVVEFDPQEEKKYLPIKSAAGPLLFVLEKVEPYLDGFVVTFRVGNPTSATFRGAKGKVFWGPRYEATVPLAQREKMQSRTFDDPTTFPAGSWTYLKVNIAPATAAQARQIMVSPEFSQLSLRSPS